MNSYPRHIGDWMKATAHLTEIEECIYGRCIDQYYIREKPLPTDVAQVCRLVRAISPAAKKAVMIVLDEFFVLQDDGWHQKRCDEEVEKCHSKQADSEARKEAERNRQREHRQRRSHLFEALRNQGIVLPYNTPTTELVMHLSRVTAVTDTQTVTPDATAIPISNNQYPITNSRSVAPRTVTGTAPLPAPAAFIKKFRMNFAWTYSPDFLSRIGLFGLNQSDVTAERVGEFVSHWSAQEVLNSQEQWEHRLAASIKRSVVRDANSPKKETGSDFIARNTDRSWARGLEGEEDDFLPTPIN